MQMTQSLKPVLCSSRHVRTTRQWQQARCQVLVAVLILKCMNGCRPDPNESPFGRPDPALQSATNLIQSSDQDYEAVMK